MTHFVLFLLHSASWLFFTNDLGREEPTKSRCFRDINYFKLEGIGELEAHQLNQYPYFEIIEMNQHKRLVVFRYSKTTADSSVYERQKTYWFNVEEVQEMLSHIYIYKYIFEDRVLELTYLFDYNLKSGEDVPDDYDKIPFTTEDHFLQHITLITEDQNLEYITRKKYKIKPSPTIEYQLKNLKYSLRFQTTYSLSDSVLRVENKQLYPREENILDGVRCYSLLDEWGNKHTRHWYLFSSTKEIDCK